MVRIGVTLCCQFFDIMIHPFFSWSSSPPPSISVCRHHSFSNPSDRIIKNPSLLFSAVCYSISFSSIPISMRTLSLVFLFVHDILCIFLHALIFFSIFFVIVHVPQPYRTVRKSVSSLSFLRVYAHAFLIQSL